jgi:hypothetical protein
LGISGAEIRLRQIRVRELHEFALEAGHQARENGVLPITVHRARAQMKNPHADGDETGLLVAYMGQQRIGYMGILPGCLRSGEQFSKVHWLSTWYVAPPYRRTSVALELLMNALSSRDAVLAGVSPPAEKVYRRIALPEMGPLTYYILDLQRLSLLALVPKLAQKALRRFPIIPRGVDRALERPRRALESVDKRGAYALLMPVESTCLAEINTQEVYCIDPGWHGTPNAGSTEFYRGPEVINWMLQHQWIVGPDEAEASAVNYYFSGVRDLFKYIALKVYAATDAAYKGFVIFSVSALGSSTVLKVLDFGFSNEADGKYAFWLAVRYARAHQADAIELPADLARFTGGSMIARLGLRKAYRTYFCRPKDANSPLAVSLDRIKLQYSDGDTAFT